MNCGVWRYHPTQEDLRGRRPRHDQPLGPRLRRHGEMFITNCVIDHLWHVVPGGHLRAHVRPGPQPARLRPDAEHLPTTSTGAAATGPTSRGGKGEHADAGGGHAHAGCMIYLGDNWPDRYRNGVFMLQHPRQPPQPRHPRTQRLRLRRPPRQGLPARQRPLVPRPGPRSTAPTAASTSPTGPTPASATTTRSPTRRTGGSTRSPMATRSRSRATWRS